MGDSINDHGIDIIQVFGNKYLVKSVTKLTSYYIESQQLDEVGPGAYHVHMTGPML